MTIVGRKNFEPTTLAGAGRLREGERHGRSPMPMPASAPHRTCAGCSSRRPSKRRSPRSPYDGTGPRDGRTCSASRSTSCAIRRPTPPADQGRARSRPTRSRARSGTRRCPMCRRRPRAGCPTSQVGVWHGLYVPKDTPGRDRPGAHCRAQGGARRPERDRRSSPSSARCRCPRTRRRPSAHREAAGADRPLEADHRGARA